MQSSQTSMTAAEITAAILAQRLYEFKAKSPKDIVRSAIERHCEGVTRKNSAKEKYFRKESPGIYALIQEL